MMRQSFFLLQVLFLLLPVSVFAQTVQTVQTARISGGMRGPYCLRIHKGGDLDFGGTPEFRTEVSVQMSSNQKRVELRTFLNGHEPRNDESWGTNSVTEYLWELPPGATFRKLSKVYPSGNREQGNTFFSRWMNYTDEAENRNQNQKLNPPLAVKRFYVVPDVPGPDITPEPNPDCSGKANVRFDLYDYEVEYEIPAPLPSPAASSQSAGGSGTLAPTGSPAMVTTGTINAKAVVINYGQPSVRGRNVWTSLSPYGKLWRTGANAATTIRFGRDVLIEGQSLAAGTYALFTIPSPERWTLIFNRKTDQWGAYSYNPAEDALRVEVNSSPHMFTEQLTFIIRAGGVLLFWADKEVFFRID